MRRSQMPSRAAPMRLCGKQYWSAGEIPEGARLKDGDCPCGALHAWPSSPARPPVLAARPRATGFSARVKLAVRARAGDGEIDDARCEACDTWLGRYGGQVQHIVARGAGGTSNPVLATIVNAALLCGTPQDKKTCHGLAESRDPGMRARGFWLPQGTDPRLKPMMLASRYGSGALTWRSEDGEYLFEAPAGAA
jgi:hypothetical protein